METFPLPALDGRPRPLGLTIEPVNNLLTETKGRVLGTPALSPRHFPAVPPRNPSPRAAQPESAGIVRALASLGTGGWRQLHRARQICLPL